ncbi:PREDICTED: D-lactate dehydrogenase [cytochrome], mitochondrial-like isoform X2 [Prunus mume]|uniref:D-lactate dehydrogenase (cytochrome) n=1 Tax=Prunus mume TaxID=102107 RepID=A0ABM1LWU1_PRUMU|nr:PREDICTED: D-lactate dehydrogenase [cytochrome], mitochondrial-like isoform X2 [Prunus mume]
MAMSSWFSRLRCSSKCFFNSLALRTSVSRKLVRTQTTTNSESTRNPFLFWSRSLLPIALAVSAGSLALHPQSDPSLCEASSVNSRAEFVVKGSHKEVPRELIDELKAICQVNMTLDYEERYNHGKPQNSFHKAVNIPDVVVFPRSEEQVSKIVKSCDKHKVPIVPYGGATSLEGHTLSPNGGVCIDMSLMNRVKALHVEDMDVVVEPGVGWMELNEYVEPYGLFFPLDPGPGATIGGMCATRCSGSLAVRLLCVIFLQLRMLQMLLLLLCCLEYRVELLDEVQIRAINIANGKSLPETPTLMFEFIGTEAYSREQTLIVKKIASEHNGSDFVFAEDPETKKELWKMRKEALWACFAMEPNFEAMISDVCVPLSCLAELISRSKQELDASELICTVIAHAGDGNFHTVILFDPNNEEHRQEAQRLNHFMVHTALSMEGTCTGEHGVGTGKMKYLEQELGMEALKTMKRIKAALDPNNTMNPGKLIPSHVCF